MTTKSNLAISIYWLDKKLDKKQVLFWLDLEVEKWEVFWFLWPNWAWKTTTMKCLLGLIKPDWWEIMILWEKWLTKETRSHIWFMPENTYLYRYLNWYEFLKFNAKFFTEDNSKIDSKIGELLEKVWLKEAASKLLAKYSKWMLQRIGLAQALVNDPEIVFLDEPMSWLDPLWRKMVKDLILELKSKGTTVFFNTHILSDVEAICDKFAIIHKGRIIERWNVGNLKKPLEDLFIEKIEDASNWEKIEII